MREYNLKMTFTSMGADIKSVIFIVCSVSFIVCVALCAVFCVLFCMICVLLCVVSYYGTTATG
jgi:hypothetical protein